MSKRAPTSQLKEAIERIVADKKLVFSQKVRRIFELEKQTGDDEDPNTPVPWLKRGAWLQLKQEEKYWENIHTLLATKEIPFVSLSSMRDEEGRLTFGMIEIANLLGDQTPLIYELETAIRVLPLEQQRETAQRLFIRYVRWYDDTPMAFSYVALFTRYLLFANQLVPLIKTRDHRDALPLVETEDDELAIFSYLMVIATVPNTTQRDSGHYLFTQAKNSREFRISYSDRVYTVQTEGQITRIVKFVYTPYIILVLSGANDNKLVRFRLDLKEEPVRVIEPFRLPEECTFDDLLVVDLEQSHRFASHMKAFVSDSADVACRVFDVKALSEINTTNYDTRRLVLTLIMPTYHAYKPANAKEAYTSNDMVIIAARTFAYPYRRSLHEHDMALLLRRFTGNMTRPWELTLRLYRYKMEGPNPVAPVVIRNATKPLNDFMRYTEVLRGMRLIFHSPSIFYIETLLYETEPRRRYKVLSSHLTEVDFTFPVRFGGDENTMTPVDVTKIKDGELFELIRAKGYRVYDVFRHVNVPNYTPKYDTIFYRHDYERQYSRFIFYKSTETQPMVANLTMRTMSPYALRDVVPMPLGDTLCIMSILTETRENIRGRIQVRVSPEPVVFRVRDQVSFTAFEQRSFSLDTQFATQLSLSSSQKAVCRSCHEAASVKDITTGHLYCDELCQRLFCTTLRL